MAVTGLTRNQFIGFNAGTRVRIPPSPFKTMKMPDIVWHFHRFLRTPYGTCYFYRKLYPSKQIMFRADSTVPELKNNAKRSDAEKTAGILSQRKMIIECSAVNAKIRIGSIGRSVRYQQGLFCPGGRCAEIRVVIIIFSVHCGRKKILLLGKFFPVLSFDNYLL